MRKDFCLCKKLFTKKQFYTNPEINRFIQDMQSLAKEYKAEKDMFLHIETLSTLNHETFYRLEFIGIPTEKDEFELDFNNITIADYYTGRKLLENEKDEEEDDDDCPFDGTSHYKPLEQPFREPIPSQTEIPSGRFKDKVKAFVNEDGSYNTFRNVLSEMVLGQEHCIDAVAYNVFAWLKGVASGSLNKNNMFLAAPSGCGKTETFRALEKLFKKFGLNIPVIKVDMQNVVSEGYKGVSLSEALVGLAKAENGVAIVVLDELDKRITNSGTYFTFGQELMSELLTIIEGTTLNIKGKKINTERVLFFAAGAFTSFRVKRNEKPKIGFNSVEEKAEEIPDDADLTMEDLLQAGCMTELAGRFSAIVNYKKLDKTSVDTIVKRYVNSFIEQTGVNITLTDAGVDELYEDYINSPFGCRTLKSKLWERLLPSLVEVEKNKTKAKNKKKAEIVYESKDCIYIEESRRKTKKKVG